MLRCLSLMGIKLENEMYWIRTNTGVLTMRDILLVKGDLISAEVRSVQNYSSTLAVVLLHSSGIIY